MLKTQRQEKENSMNGKITVAFLYKRSQPKNVLAKRQSLLLFRFVLCTLTNQFSVKLDTFLAIVWRETVVFKRYWISYATRHKEKLKGTIHNYNKRKELSRTNSSLIQKIRKVLSGSGLLQIDLNSQQIDGNGVQS